MRCYFGFHRWVYDRVVHLPHDVIHVEFHCYRCGKKNVTEGAEEDRGFGKIIKYKVPR